VATGEFFAVAVCAGAGEVVLEAVGVGSTALRVIVHVEAVREAALQRRLGVVVVAVGFGAVRVLGAVRGGVGAGVVVVQADGFDAVAEFLLLEGGIALGLDLGLALAVGGFGFLEDVDDVLALEDGGRQYDGLGSRLYHATLRRD